MIQYIHQEDKEAGRFVLTAQRFVVSRTNHPTELLITFEGRYRLIVEWELIVGNLYSMVESDGPYLLTTKPGDKKYFGKVLNLRS